MNKVEAVNLLGDIDDDQDPEDPAPPPLMTPIASDEEEEPEAVDENIPNENDTGKEKQVSFAGPDAKVMRAMKNLNGVSYSPVAEQIVRSGRIRLTRSSKAGMGMGYFCKEVAKAMIDQEKVAEKNEKPKVQYEEPKNFDQPWNHPNKVERKKWRAAITKEREDIAQRVIWKTCLLYTSPSPRDRG